MRTVCRYALLLVALIGVRTLEARGQEVAKEDSAPPKTAETKSDEKPEAALRTFLIGMFEQDAEALRGVILPTEQVDFDWLVKGPRLPDDVRKGLRAEIAEIEFKRLKVGDEIKLAGRPYVVTERDVAKDRVALLPPDHPMFYRLRQVDNAWRVDPSPLIAARKAADISRKRAEKAKQQQAEKPPEESSSKQP